MEKKFKFTDKPGAAKVIYGVIIAVLCITAIIVGIVAANNRKKPALTPGTGDKQNGDNSQDGNTPDDNTPDLNEPSGNQPDGNDPVTEDVGFISPVVGTVVKEHSLTVPVYSETLEEWRVHAGIDVSTKEGEDVFCVADGEVEKVFHHPLHGFTVIVKHSESVQSIYSNLDENSGATPKVGDKLRAGDKLGNVGDSSLSELAEEPHLHFEITANGVAVNPLDYISDDAKRASLGMEIGEKNPEA